jgi:hypothetical protein
MQSAQQVQSNPDSLAQILYQNGKINQEQFSALKGKSPTEMGEYLVNNNLIPNIEALKKQAQMFMK